MTSGPNIGLLPELFVKHDPNGSDGLSLRQESLRSLEGTMQLPQSYRALQAAKRAASYPLSFATPVILSRRQCFCITAGALLRMK